MNDEVKSIELIFENCEFVAIDAENIGCFWIDNITEEIARYACNFIGKYRRCTEIFLELKKEVNKNNIDNLFDKEEYLFDRIRTCENITQIYINYVNGAVDVILVPWGEEEYTNEYQSHFMSDDNMYICISKEKTANEIYDKISKG